MRVRAQCQPGSKFVAYLAKVPREKSYRLKTLNLTHTCTRSYKNPRCTASYIGKKLLKKVRRQPDIRLKDIQDAMHEKYVDDISAGKASRARGKAQEAVDGAYTAQFNQLWEYCDELRRCSPGSTILMKVHTYNDGDLAAEHDLAIGLPYFQRIYICLEGCKKGFLAGCRPIIGLDACHLKTKTGGQLMCAVGRDPNDEYFPLAYAVVEAETKDSWTWFLNLLLADIGDARTWVFISDQQKVWFLNMFCLLNCVFMVWFRTTYCLLVELCFYGLVSQYFLLVELCFYGLVSQYVLLAELCFYGLVSYYLLLAC